MDISDTSQTKTCLATYQRKMQMIIVLKILLENILPAHVAEHYLIQVRGVPLSASASVSSQHEQQM